VDSPVLDLSGEALDYTDLIASPSLWADPLQLRRIADAVALPPHHANAFLEDPDSFLQSPIEYPYQASWIEHPLMELELDWAWKQHVDQTIRASIRTAAIVRVFEDAPIRRRCA
jgi:hypothetical protein